MWCVSFQQKNLGRPSLFVLSTRAWSHEVIDDDDIRVSAAQHTVASTAEALGRGEWAGCGEVYGGGLIESDRTILVPI